jgi:hypothetical protein
MLKHPESYRCDVIGCRRTVRVTTVGDLERHKRSRHWQTNQKGYQCAAKQCRNRDKNGCGSTISNNTLSGCIGTKIHLTSSSGMIYLCVLTNMVNELQIHLKSYERSRNCR